MAHLHNLRNHNTTFMSRFGEKVKHVAAVVGTAKGLYDVGRTLYQIGQVAIPASQAILYKSIT